MTPEFKSRFHVENISENSKIIPDKFYVFLFVWGIEYKIITLNTRQNLLFANYPVILENNRGEEGRQQWDQSIFDPFQWPWDYYIFNFYTFRKPKARVQLVSVASRQHFKIFFEILYYFSSVSVYWICSDALVKHNSNSRNYCEQLALTANVMESSSIMHILHQYCLVIWLTQKGYVYPCQQLNKRSEEIWNEFIGNLTLSSLNPSQQF